MKLSLERWLAITRPVPKQGAGHNSPEDPFMTKQFFLDLQENPHEWTGLMIGFAPAPTDRTTFDQGNYF
jgi:hypothetical protein